VVLRIPGAFDEIKSVRVQPTTQNVIQPRHAGRDSSIYSPSCDAMRLARQSAHRLTKFALTQPPASANGSRFAASHGTLPAHSGRLTPEPPRSEHDRSYTASSLNRRKLPVALKPPVGGCLDGTPRAHGGACRVSDMALHHFNQ
jgi:hypothetical protein